MPTCCTFLASFWQVKNELNFNFHLLFCCKWSPVSTLYYMTKKFHKAILVYHDLFCIVRQNNTDPFLFFFFFGEGCRVTRVCYFLYLSITNG